MALSKKFHWVTVDRDRTPALPKRFGVNAYPTLLTLGSKQEKVHRFSGFKKPADFLPRLQDALRRHELYRQGKEWDEPDPRPATITKAGTVETFAAPSEEVPSGLAFLQRHAWVVQGSKLFKLDLSSGATVATFDVPASIVDLCTDGVSLYGVDYGWTAAKPIYVIDPKTGKVTRSIVTEANRKNRASGAKGVAWRAGKLYVLEGMRGKLHEVDPKTGAVARTIQSEGRWLAGLAFDGTHFVAGGREALWLLDPATGKTMRKVAVNYRLRTVGFHGGSYYLMEQPIFGHDKQHKRIQVWPRRTLVHKLTLR